MEEYDFGKVLQYERKKRGITQAELAKVTGFTIRAISYWENGNRKMSLATATKVFERMGLKLKIVVEDNKQ